VLAFWYSLHALGTQLPMVDVAVAYLAGSAIGAASPTPGGLGAIEAALTGILIRFKCARRVSGGGGCSCSAW
jgi:uncharacterized membrane protein YbhN (UPF0104 family)